MARITTQDRYRGCLLGLAAGDALGTTLEFRAPGTFRPIEDMTGGGPFGLRPGQWTDDTSMALCLAASLIESGGFDALDQMRRYVRWRDEGYMSSTGFCFDIGNTVSDALRRFTATSDPYSGATDRWSAGNGSLMRLAPVPMLYAADAEEAVERCADSSRTTHASDEAVDACRYYGGLLVSALNGTDKATLLSDGYSPVDGLWQRAEPAGGVAAVAYGSFKALQPPDIEGTGYVVKSLEAALWAFHNSRDFREGALMAANLGDDADTTAAIYGQLAGAHYGASGIPEEWRAKLAMANQITRMADDLHGAAIAHARGRGA